LPVLSAIRDNTVNAFAMFGGFIGVNTGTLLTAQSESELAGVLAHEISHVIQNHLARQIAREKQSSIATMVAMAIGVLAARSNSQVASAAIASAQAGRFSRNWPTVATSSARPIGWAFRR
jgi:predicted Zn-dependent protease